MEVSLVVSRCPHLRKGQDDGLEKVFLKSRKEPNKKGPQHLSVPRA